MPDSRSRSARGSPSDRSRGSPACPVDGTAFLAYDVGATLLVAVRDPVTSWWAHEYADWNTWTNAAPDLQIGADGQPAVGYRSANGPTGAGGSDGNNSVSFARRTAPAP